MGSVGGVLFVLTGAWLAWATCWAALGGVLARRRGGSLAIGLVLGATLWFLAVPVLYLAYREPRGRGLTGGAGPTGAGPMVPPAGYGAP